MDNEIQKRISDGEACHICVFADYFREGDYSDWQKNSDETENMTYKEFQDWLVKDMEKYDRIEVYSDGCIYGVIGGISHDISYGDFDDVEKFIELAEKYGICEVEFA